MSISRRDFLKSNIAAVTATSVGIPISQVVNAADAEEGWFRYVIDKKCDQWPSQFTVENYPTLTEIRSVLEQVHTETEAFLDSLGNEDLEKIINTPWDESIPLGWIIWHVLEHEVHHRGELSLILGMLGREGLDV